MSVLRIRYVFFRILMGEDGDGCAKQTREILLKFPGLLVLDEGHTARNQHRFVWNTLQKIEREKHILLFGSPFLDNIKDLYNPLCVVSQKFAADLEQKRYLLFGQISQVSGNRSKILHKSTIIASEPHKTPNFHHRARS
ncbi:hypothetical protein R3W88_001253 [Solanum pinnatisectum]|uniref:SNF2 N-terminal domain-containing protein n=1 Tax=Solanum pinnatisectum TaxID=50273 RepID=A0AAV9MHZ8_9SOLN|nr:hypothetical protein R3W88_001253 [Solanum pinnatisectum]